MTRFERLVGPRLDPMRYRCRRARLSREDAEDVVAEAVFRALERFEEFDPVKGCFSTWMNRFLLGSYRDHARRLGADKRLMAALQGAIPARDHGLPSLPDLKRLTPTMARTFYLTRVYGFERAETARIMGRHVRRVDESLSGALKVLREWAA